MCTVGITENGKLIRLYPIPFRYTAFRERYSKYQWVEMEIEKNKNDKRIDSYRPRTGSTKLLGKPISTGKSWQERKDIVLPLASQSLEEIDEERRKSGVSLGVFKPQTISLKFSKTSESWGAKQESILRQGVLIGSKTKALEKIPFKFSYEIRCADSRCKGHSLTIMDWEINELYRNVKDRYGYSLDVVLEKVKQRFETQMWAENRDSYLIVGTQYPYATFMVLGVFWPPKV